MLIARIMQWWIIEKCRAARCEGLSRGLLFDCTPDQVKPCEMSRSWKNYRHRFVPWLAMNWKTRYI